MKKFLYGKKMVTIAFEILLLGISFCTSLILVDFWTASDLLHYVQGGLVVVLMAKLSVILVFYKPYTESQQLENVLPIVAIYNLFSFICLNLINIKLLYEVCTINVLVDLLFVGTHRSLIKKGGQVKQVKRNERFAQFSQKRAESAISLHNGPITVGGSSPLILLKDMGIGELDRVKVLIPKGTIVNISVKDGTPMDLGNLLTIINENAFDSIIVDTKNFYRLEFLDLFDLLKDMPLPLALLDQNDSLVPLTDVEEIIKIFPLNIEGHGDFAGEEIILYHTGDLSGELCHQFVERGAKKVTLVDGDANLTPLFKKYKGRDDVVLLSSVSEAGSRDSLFEQCDRIVYGLPVDQIETGEREVRGSIKKNIFGTEEILERLPKGVKSFTFVSSTLATNPLSVIGVCYGNVEELVQSANQTMDTHCQVVRLPNYLKEENGFLRALKDDPMNHIVEANPREVFVHLYDKREATCILLNAIHHGESVGVYVGEQVFLADLVSDLNFKGIWEDKIRITFSRETYPINLYMEYEDTSFKGHSSYFYPLPIGFGEYHSIQEVVHRMERKIQGLSEEECRKRLMDCSVKALRDRVEWKEFEQTSVSLGRKTEAASE